MMTTNLSRDQLEQTLNQRIQTFYLEKLGHCPRKVNCQFFNEKLAISLENVITQSEQLLMATDREEFAIELRTQIDDAIKPGLVVLIEETTGVSVNSLLNTTDLKSGFSSMVAVLN